MSTVCVHGLGYVGLPTAALLADAGHEITGYDVDRALLDRLSRGEITVDEPGLEAILERVLGESLVPSGEPVPAAYHLVCVPTPLSSDDGHAGADASPGADTEAHVGTGRIGADLSAVEAAGETITGVLRPEDTVILESTVPPGTTTRVLGPLLERSGLTVGEFSLAYSPETVLPGSVVAELRANDRDVGGVDERSVRRARELYASFVDGELRTTTDPTFAEFVKLIQNTYRDTNIALANELAKIAADYGLDAREAIASANHHPRVEIHQPGPGVGGHCIPIDPLFLGQSSDQLDLIERARAVNDGMAGYVADLIESHRGSLAGAQVAILGIAYKGNVADTRGSPGLRLAGVLEERARARPAAVAESTSESQGRLADAAPRARGADQPVGERDGGTSGTRDGPLEVRLHDPHVADQRLALCPLDEALSGADAVVVAADHDEYADLDPAACERLQEPFVVDAKGVLDAAAWEAAGATVRRI
jgi:UDP-N-acetyl-D-mannosaminuronic acid dehydrogenase